MEYKLNLSNVRIKHKLNQNEVANILGITRTVYTKYENGYELIPIKHLVAFCNYFDISVDYIFSLTNNDGNSSYNKEINYDLIRQRIKEFRKENRLTQEKLACILNTNKSVICNYEKGRHFIATPFLYQICHKYHISADYLLGRTNNPKYLG